MLRYLWAGPGSLLGLPLAWTFRRRQRRSGVLIAEGADWPRRIGWRFRAITLGHVILCVDEADDALLAHELVHVGQWERWGPLLLLAYPLASLISLLRGRRPYLDNPFEIAARVAQEKAPAGEAGAFERRGSGRGSGPR